MTGLTRALTAVLLAIPPATVNAECRQALALGLDVSGSVDADEYRLQMNGLAAALEQSSVTAALLQYVSAPVVISVYDWSGPESQRLIVPWTPITDATKIGYVTATLRTTPRQRMEVATALGQAMSYGVDLLQQMPTCWQATLDLTGDGKSNSGPLPQDTSVPEGMTVNALVIGPGPNRPTGEAWVEASALVAYFEAWVIRGPDAFVEVANGFEDFEAAMTRKLLREIQGLSLVEATGQRSP